MNPATVARSCPTGAQKDRPQIPEASPIHPVTAAGPNGELRSARRGGHPRRFFIGDNDAAAVLGVVCRVVARRTAVPAAWADGRAFGRAGIR